jgi:hypothetical protein
MNIETICFGALFDALVDSIDLGVLMGLVPNLKT